MLTTQIVFPSSYITHKQKQQYVLYHDMFAMRPKQDAMSQWLNDCQSSLDDRWRNWCEIARVPLTFFSMVAGLTYLCYRKWNFQHGRQQHDDDGASGTSQEVYAEITNDIRVRNGAENLEMESGEPDENPSAMEEQVERDSEQVLSSRERMRILLQKHLEMAEQRGDQERILEVEAYMDELSPHYDP